MRKRALRFYRKKPIEKKQCEPLLPCAVCGSSGDELNTDDHSVWCCNCQNTVGGRTFQKAKENWNAAYRRTHWIDGIPEKEGYYWVRTKLNCTNIYQIGRIKILQTSVLIYSAFGGRIATLDSEGFQYCGPLLPPKER